MQTTTHRTTQAKTLTTTHKTTRKTIHKTMRAEMQTTTQTTTVQETTTNLRQETSLLRSLCSYRILLTQTSSTLNIKKEIIGECI